MKWIITANTNNSRIYNYQSNELKLIKEIDHPENKLKSHELGSDKPGRYQSNDSSRGAFSPHTALDEINVDDFAREIAVELNEARNQNAYDELVVIMPAQMEGLFSKHLNKNVKALIKHTIQKNIMHLSEKELLDFLNENSRPGLRE